MQVNQISSLSADYAIGLTISQYLAVRKIQQRLLAVHVGVTQSMLSRKLNGLTSWKIEELIRIAELLGVGLQDLMPVEDVDGNWLPAPFKPGYAKAPALAGATGWAHRESNPEPTD